MKTFKFAPGLELRVIDRDGEPWFVARDVCAALGFVVDKRGTTFYIARLKVGQIDTPHLGGGYVGNPIVRIINEVALYALILKSRKPAAVEFQRWISEQVLPTIRKTGGYMLPAVAG